MSIPTDMIVSTQSAFLALKSDGSTVTGDMLNILKIVQVIVM